MDYIKLFEEFIFEAKMHENFFQKVAWLLPSNDIASTSGDVNAREKKYNVAARNDLFVWFGIADQRGEEGIQIPEGMPIINYGMHNDKTWEFLHGKSLVYDNVYNKWELLPLSGNKMKFSEKAGKFSWLPKTVFSIDQAANGAVGFPVIAKIKAGHSGQGIEKFDSAKELKESKNKFDLFCQFIDFEREYRVLFCKDRLVLLNERVPTIDDNSSIRTKKAEDKIRFTYVYQDPNKVDKKFIEDLHRIRKDIKTFLDLDLFSIDIVVDKAGKLWVMETSAAAGTGSSKMCEIYRAVYEDFYKRPLPDEFLEHIYLKYIVPGHQNYYPKYKKEIQSSKWAMDYDTITNPKVKNGYRYFFNLDNKE